MGSLDGGDFSIEGCLPGAEGLAPLSQNRACYSPVSDVTHPSPADRRNEPSVQAWTVWVTSAGAVQGVYCLGLGMERSTPYPSLMRSPWPEAPPNHRDRRFRVESSVTGAWRRAPLSDPGGAARAEARRSLSRRRSNAGRVGGMSAARMASSPFST